MCTNKRLVRNPYTGKEIYVNCGKCESCKQEKADKRTIRIINNCPQGYIPLFFHLTYSPESLPYIDISELSLIQPYTINKCPVYNHVGVYRDSYRRFYYNPHTKNTQILQIDEVCHLTDYFYDTLLESDFEKFHIVDDCKVGVLYYPDIQLFFKRLRQNLVRNEVYKDIYDKSKHHKCMYFVCGEMGETFSRPHWHIILYVPQFEVQNLSKWRQVIANSWLLADYNLTYENVDFAIAAASYASSYVNSSSEISRFFQNADFRPCWHYSHGFGFDNDNFSLSSILDSIEKRDLRYVETIVSKDGKCRNVTCTFPSYVSNRWFPPFKGFCNLTYEEIEDVIGVPSNVIRYKDKLGLSDIEISEYINMVHRYSYRFKLATTQPNYGDSFWYNIAIDESFNFNNDEPFYNKHSFTSHYAFWYVSFLKARSSTKFRLQYSDFKDDYDYVQRYDNILDIKQSKPLTYRFFRRSFRHFDIDKYVCSCNEFKDNKALTLRKSERYNKKIKQRRITQISSITFIN